MVVKRGGPPQLEQRPVFLDLKPGDIVIVWEHPEIVGSDEKAWWMGQVIFLDGSARDPKAPSLVQVADVDTGVIRWVNADCIEQILMPITSKFARVCAEE